MCISLCNLLGALGCQYVMIALWQWFDWGTDILFLDAEIYGSEFREHPSFAATRTAAIFFDVTGFIALVWALRRKAMYQLRIRKAAREGKFRYPDGRESPIQREVFEKAYLGGQTFLKTAVVLLLLEDIPEAVITVHVIQATPGGMSSIAWLAVITSCGGVVYALGNWFYNTRATYPGDIDESLRRYYDYDVMEHEGIGRKIFEDPNAPGLCALLREFSMLDAAEAQVHATELAGHVRA